VLSGCVERPLLDTAPIGRVAFGDARPSDTQVGSTVLANPDAPAQALELSYDAAYAGIAVTVEDASSGGSWAAHVASMERTMNADGRRDPGVGLRIDVDLDGPLATRIAREHYLNSFTSAVAAEAQADGSLVYLWTVRSASESIDSPNTVAFRSCAPCRHRPCCSAGSETPATSPPSASRWSTRSRRRSRSRGRAQDPKASRASPCPMRRRHAQRSAPRAPC
jgi:hypothetical protein